jgi:hypothetical protein
MVDGGIFALDAFNRISFFVLPLVNRTDRESD